MAELVEQIGTRGKYSMAAIAFIVWKSQPENQKHPSFQELTIKKKLADKEWSFVKDLEDLLHDMDKSSNDYVKVAEKISVRENRANEESEEFLTLWNEIQAQQTQQAAMEKEIPVKVD